MVPWASRPAAFVRSSSTPQHRLLAPSTTRARRCDVVLVDGVPAGRLYVDRAADEIRDRRHRAPARVPRRRRGWSPLLGPLLDEADRDGLPVTIHVERPNPALHLYDRLGFEGGRRPRGLPLPPPNGGTMTHLQQLEGPRISRRLLLQAGSGATAVLVLDGIAPIAPAIAAGTPDIFGAPAIWTSSGPRSRWRTGPSSR